MAASLPSLSKTFSQAAQEQSVVQYLCPRKQSQYNLMHFDWRHIHPVEVRFLLPDTATLSPASTTVFSSPCGHCCSNCCCLKFGNGWRGVNSGQVHAVSVWR